MRTFVFTIAALLSTAFVAFGQYAPQEEQPVVEDVTLSKAYKSAKGVMIGGIVVAGVGLTTNLVGNVVCVIEQNKYTNSRYTQGGIEEYARLSQEAKQQPGYKTGVILEGVGFGVMLVGGGLIWYGAAKMKKIRNSSGKTVSTLDYGLSPYGAGLTFAF